MVLAITLVSSSTARLSWDAVAMATAYDLYRSTSAYFTATGSPWQTVSAPTVLSTSEEGSVGGGIFGAGTALDIDRATSSVPTRGT